MTSTQPQQILLSLPHLSGREMELVAEAIASNYIAPLGPHVDRFEAMMREITGFRHVLALSSGTAALHLALRLAGVGLGDEVWCPSMTFIGGVAPIMYQGAKPRFFDCDENALIDLDLVETALKDAAASGKLPKVLMIADLYGLTCDSARAQALAARYGVKLVNDAAESLGSLEQGQSSGRGAWAAGYSFNGNKIITTSGGGALATDDGEMIDRARFLSTQAREPAPHYEHETFGYNYRLSNICAAIGCAQLEVLPDRVARRRAISARYEKSLSGLPGLRFLAERKGSTANRWLTVLLFDQAVTGVSREQVRLALHAAGIEARPAWKPMHMQPVFKDAAYAGGKVSEQIFEQGLCLPSGSAMTDDDVDRVIGEIMQVLNAGRT
jgi:pyridoxal phosphate-dependent aminotransferase EpsN